MRRALRLVLTASVTLAAAAGAYTSFGKNKVQYYDHDWMVVHGDHVDVYFYGAERELAQRAANIAEEAWEELARRMRFTPRSRIPLIIYSSHGEFEETNILPYILPEGVGGFTELLKNRVVVPFEGSYPRFRRVLRHELTHYFMYEKLRDVYARHNRYDYGAPPFWLVEGLAEYMAGGWDSYADMVLADAVYSGALVPLSKASAIAGTYLAYKEGESALRYLAATYGEDKIIALLDGAWLSRDWRQVLDLTLPVPFAQFDADWQRALRMRYWPRYATHAEFAALGTDVTNGEGLRSGVGWLDRHRLVYLSDEDGYANLYLVAVDDEGRRVERRTLVRGETTRSYAVVHVYQERPATWGGKLVAFSARAGGRDRLYVYDVDRDAVTERYEFPELVVLGTPSFSPDGAELVFRGMTREGYADLYVVNRADGERRALTADAADDIYPTWTAAGIVFASQRDAAPDQDHYNLYRLDATTGATARLTAGPWRDLYPTPAGDGSLLFISDRFGQYDVYELTADATLTRLSSSLTGVLEASPRPGGEEHEAAVVGINDQQYQIRVATLTPQGDGAVPPAEGPAPVAGPVTAAPPAARVYPVRSYRPSFGLDYFSAEVAYGPEFGTATGIVISLTDLLSDQTFLLELGNDAQALDDFLARTSVGVDYYNLHGRWGYGASAFHYVDDYVDYRAGVNGLAYSETRAGGGFMASYPFDRFHRVSASLYGYELERVWEAALPPEYGTKVAPYLSAARDTSLWYQDGPIDGQRLNATAGVTEDVRRKRTDYLFLEVDLRHYLRTTRTQCFAFRAAGAGTFGPDARPLYAGGSLSMRGYDFFSFEGRQFAMFNVEYRFPLLEPFQLRTAVGAVPTPPLRGALFFDAGEAFDDPHGYPDGPRGSFGLGLRMVLWSVLTLRTDHAWLTDFHRLGPFVPIKFFVGWSY
jgi:hypothetical protein